MGTKVKITRQKIKEDKFTTWMLRRRDWIMYNWQILAIAGIVVVVAIVAVVYYTEVQSNRELAASGQLGRAMDELRRQNYQVAILELNDIVDEYGGEIAGKALFNLANAYYASRNYSEAMTRFQEYIDNYRGNILIVSSAIAGVAACYEGTQEFQMAADKYVEAVRYYPESPSVPDYLLGAVRNYINVGNISRAEESLEELSVDHSRSDQYRTAIRLVAQSKS